jgi:hypothetical protein
MGRKDFKQRVKGNLSPATSSRSQDIMGAAFAFTPNQSFAVIPLDDKNQPAELRVILSALAKKDATTRAKALEELILYFSSPDINPTTFDDFIKIWVKWLLIIGFIYKQTRQ